MAVKDLLEAHVVAVNAFSNEIAAAVTNIAADIAALKTQLAGATTEKEVGDLLAPAMANLTAAATALKALDAENEPEIPPVEPPVEPPL